MNTQNHNGILQTKTQAPVQPGSTIHPSNHPTIQKSIDPAPSTRPPAPPFSPFSHVKPPRRRNGKVARLPHVARTLVNTMLDDGFTYNAIVAKLEELGYPGFLQQNISRWSKGGYQTWLIEQRFQAVFALVDKANGKAEASPRAFDPPALTAAHTE